MHDGPVHRHPLQAQAHGWIRSTRARPSISRQREVWARRIPARSRVVRPPISGGSLDNRPLPTTAASSTTGRCIGPSRENGGRTPDGRRVGFWRVDSKPAKTPRTVDRDSRHSSSSSSSVAVPIRIIIAGPTSLGRVFQRCIGQLTRRALLLRSRYRPKNSVPSPFVVGRSTRTGVVPRERYLSGRHRPGRRRIIIPPSLQQKSGSA